MGFFLSRRWKRQPQGPSKVDWSNPLARGLRGLLVPFGGGWFDAVAEQPLVLTSSGSFGQSLGGAPGLVRSYATARAEGESGSGQSFDLPSVLGNIALFAVARIAPGASKGTILHTRGNTTTAGAQLALLDTAGTTVVQMDLADTATMGSATTGVPAGQFGTFGASYDGLETDFFDSGIYRARSSGTSDGMSLNCSQIAIGSRVRDSISESLVGDIAAIGIYARSVTPLEGRALTANIWQLFRPRTLRIYSLPASGPTTPRTLASMGCGR